MVLSATTGISSPPFPAILSLGGVVIEKGVLCGGGVLALTRRGVLGRGGEKDRWSLLEVGLRKAPR